MEDDLGAIWRMIWGSDLGGQFGERSGGGCLGAIWRTTWRTIPQAVLRYYGHCWHAVNATVLALYTGCGIIAKAILGIALEV